MKIVVAMDSFKGSLTAAQACLAVEKGIKRTIVDAQVVLIPFADGGEGTVDAVLTSGKAKSVPCDTVDPFGRKITAHIAWFEDSKTAVIEMAQASGLGLISDLERNPFEATTYGTGILVHHALKLGCKKIVIGLGGSATSDGGAGALAALGAIFSNADGQAIGYWPKALKEVDSVDFTQMPLVLKDVEVVLAVDVNNPLLGPKGAAAVYGPQKGVQEADIAYFEMILSLLGRAYEKAAQKKCINIPGAGAAGGLAAAFIAALDATVVSGSSLLAELCNLGEHVHGAKMLITGEGTMDAQTLNGKAPLKIAELGKKQNIMTVGFCGSLGEGYQGLLDCGFAMVNSIIPYPMSLKQAMANASDLLEEAVWRFMMFYISVQKESSK